MHNGTHALLVCCSAALCVDPAETYLYMVDYTVSLMLSPVAKGLGNFPFKVLISSCRLC
jgi:hypothetical protein